MERTSILYEEKYESKILAVLNDLFERGFIKRFETEEMKEIKRDLTEEEEREGFLYTTKVNAAKIFGKLL